MRSADQTKMAEEIARKAHAGQVDKTGADYITHPERVAARVLRAGGSPAAVAAAWLHDSVEDSEQITPSVLRKQGISEEVIAAVDAVTKREGEGLDAYCARIAANPIALKAKEADLADNTDPARVAKLPEETQRRLAAKYARVRTLLQLPA